MAQKNNSKNNSKSKQSTSKSKQKQRKKTLKHRKKMVKHTKVASAKIQNKKSFTAFISSFIVFFFIPIWVCLIKMIEVMYNLLVGFNFNTLPISYKLIFMIIIFSSIAINIKQDLGSFFLGIYSLFSIVAVVIFIYKNKDEIMDSFKSKQ